MPLVLHFWGVATDGLIEEKITAYKWVLAGARQSSCPWPDSAPNPVTEQGCYMNPAIPLLADSNFCITRKWNAFKRIQLRNRCTFTYDPSPDQMSHCLWPIINELSHHGDITLEGLAETLWKYIYQVHKKFWYVKSWVAFDCFGQERQLVCMARTWV